MGIKKLCKGVCLVMLGIGLVLAVSGIASAYNGKDGSIMYLVQDSYGKYIRYEVYANYSRIWANAFYLSSYLNSFSGLEIENYNYNGLNGRILFYGRDPYPTVRTEEYVFDPNNGATRVWANAFIAQTGLSIKDIENIDFDGDNGSIIYYGLDWGYPMVRTEIYANNVRTWANSFGPQTGLTIKDIENIDYDGANGSIIYYGLDWGSPMVRTETYANNVRTWANSFGPQTGLSIVEIENIDYDGANGMILYYGLDWGYPTVRVEDYVNNTKVWASAFNTSVGGTILDVVNIDDSDFDGVPDATDNCVLVVNADQADADGDGIGDVCDPCPNDPNNDADGDGICGNVDNCPLVANAGQEDNDGDGAGDVCDPDDDNDGVADTSDNCPLVANAGQEDNDNDGAGDVCDSDDDNDGVADTSDNCPLVANSNQADCDGDGAGDACDTTNDIVISGEPSIAKAFLWPPDHAMVDVGLDVSGITASAGSLSLSVTAVSNQPDNGLGDGDTTGDIAISGTSVSLRAERSGKLGDRIYTITVTATDACGDSEVYELEVKVPHDKGK